MQSPYCPIAKQSSHNHHAITMGSPHKLIKVTCVHSYEERSEFFERLNLHKVNFVDFVFHKLIAHVVHRFETKVQLAYTDFHKVINLL